MKIEKKRIELYVAQEEARDVWGKLNSQGWVVTKLIPNEQLKIVRIFAYYYKNEGE